MRTTARDWLGIPHYRCTCGLRITTVEYRAWRGRRLGFCVTEALGKHGFTYIYANGLPSTRGAR